MIPPAFLVPERPAPGDAGTAAAPPKDPWSRAANLLCVRLDGLGDLLMTTPALRALKDALPGRRITLLTSPAGMEAAPHIPEADESISYEAPWMKASSRPAAGEDLEMIRRLAERRFDAAVIFTVYTQNPLPAALLCFLAGVPLRLAHCRENPYQLLTDWVAEPEPGPQVRHEVRRQLDLVGAVGCRPSGDALSFRVPERARRRWRRWAADALDPAAPWVLIHPGASAPSRRYPPEGFAAAADILALGHGWQVVFTGSAGEAPLIDSIRSMMRGPSLSLAGRLDTPDLAALIAEAPLLIVNNTGPAHLAAALGTPLVDLYALTNPQHGPWRVPHRTLFHDVPCRYCYKSVCPETHHHCLRLVAPAAVAEAALSLAAETAPRPAGREP